MRRIVLVLTVLLMFSMTLGVWAAGTQDADSSAAAAGVAGAKEAPILAEMVKAGQLPPLEERLPETPLVVKTGMLVKAEDLTVKVGKYGGGVLRSITANPELDWNLRDAAMENFLGSPAHTTGPAFGNIAESFEITNNNTVYTLTLRKGMKWSDGVPVTTEDVRFAYEDVLLNTSLTPIVPSRYKAQDQPAGNIMKLAIVDDYTFRMTFDRPYGYYSIHLGVGALWGGYNELLKPSHILKPFHQKYADADELKAKLKAAGLNDKEWHRLFLQKDIVWTENMRSEAAGFPTLGPWVRVESPQDLMVMERNPYFFKVDEAGQQLPYVDRYESIIVAKAENIPLKIIAGDVNLNRDLITHDKVSLLKENEQRGGYKMVTNLVYHNAPVAIFLNYLNDDPAWREVVNQKEFRHALNKAFNYEKIIEVLFLGMGKPNPWIKPDYNPTEAGRILDSIGLDKKDSDGFRLGPDGKRFEVFFEIKEEAGDWEKIGEIVTADLEKVGLRAPMKIIASQLWLERRDAGQLKATIDWLDDVNWPILKTDYRPSQRSRWGIGWDNWLATGGTHGEEPPAWIKELYGFYGTFTQETPDSPAATKAVGQFTDWVAEYIPMFPVARDVIGPVVIPPNLGNFATQGKSSATWFAAELFYFE